MLYKNLKEYRAAYPTAQALPPPRRTRLITPAIEDDVVKLLIRAPTNCLNKIQHWILINYNIWVLESTIYRIIKRKEFT